MQQLISLIHDDQSFHPCRCQTHRNRWSLCLRESGPWSLVTRFVAFENQVPNILTKPLSHNLFKQLQVKLGLSQPHLRVAVEEKSHVATSHATKAGPHALQESKDPLVDLVNKSYIKRGSNHPCNSSAPLSNLISMWLYQSFHYFKYVIDVSHYSPFELEIAQFIFEIQISKETSSNQVTYSFKKENPKQEFFSGWKKTPKPSNCFWTRKQNPKTIHFSPLWGRSFPFYNSKQEWMNKWKDNKKNLIIYTSETFQKKFLPQRIHKEKWAISNGKMKNRRKERNLMPSKCSP